MGDTKVLKRMERLEVGTAAGCVCCCPLWCSRPWPCSAFCALFVEAGLNLLLAARRWRQEQYEEWDLRSGKDAKLERASFMRKRDPLCHRRCGLHAAFRSPSAAAACLAPCTLMTLSHIIHGEPLTHILRWLGRAGMSW